jgi:pimeloyl-ACP methyl ester carboxylesterase
MRYLKTVLWLTYIVMLTACAPADPYWTVKCDQKENFAANGVSCPSQVSHKLLTPGDAGFPTPATPASEARTISAPDSHYYLGVVEFDEYGNLFNRRQLEDLMAQLTLKDAEEGPPLIVVFTHGWHHNASKEDGNLLAFANDALSEIAALEKKVYGAKARPVVGIYVGWRGESINVDYLNNLTFWDRKNVAHAVGDGGLQELFVKLDEFRYAPKRAGKSRLVIIGHSFGGAVTYSTLHHHFVEKLTANDPLHPIGDMVVLINPAFEAMKLKPLLDIAWSKEEYQQSTRPMLMIVTSEADTPTRHLFKAGRTLSTLFWDYHSAEERALNTTAVGHYVPFITHSLVTLKPGQECQTQGAAEPVDRNAVNVGLPANKYCFDEIRKMQIKQGLREELVAKPMLLTRCDNPNDCSNVDGNPYLPKGSYEEGKVPIGSPILNIRTSAGVMSGHNDIWNPTMRAFIVEVVSSSLINLSKTTPRSQPRTPPGEDK